MPKVLFVSTVSVTSRFNIPFMKLLTEMGAEVHYAAAGEVISGFRHHIIPFSRSPFSGDNIRAYKEMKKLLQLEKFDLIHCHTPVAAAITRLVARKFNVKVIYTAHGFHFYRGAPLINWLMYYPVEKILAKYTDCLITINQEDYDLASKKFAKANIIKTHGVGINPIFTKEDTRSRFGIPESSRVLLYIAEFNKGKNHAFLIEAMKKLPTHFILLLAGDGKLFEQTKTLAKDLPNIKFFGYRKDIPDVLNAADIYVTPSLREGLPVSVMEAMAAGLPVIASKIRGHVDLITNNKNGYLFDPKDINGFVNIIKTLDLPNESVMDFNQKLLSKYSTESVNEQMERIYKCYLML